MQEQKTHATIERNPFESGDYEEWKVTISHKTILDDDLNKKVVVTAIDKTGEKPIRTTRIESRHADALNAQVENRRTYYYLKSDKN